MSQIATLKGLRCPRCGAENIRVTGVKGALGASLATEFAFGAVGNLVAGKSAAANTVTEPLQYKCGACGCKFESLPLSAPPEDALYAPCRVTFTRERSLVGAAVPQIVYLNGVKIGAVKNGASMTFDTENRFNVLFVTDQYGVAFQSEYRFEAPAGGTVSARFKRGFLPDGPAAAPAAGLPPAAGNVSPPAAPPAQAAAPVRSLPQVRFCLNCGTALPAGTLFCANCGARRFVPESQGSDAAAALPGTPVPAAATPQMPNVSGFHKFTAIFNIVIGALLLFPVLANLMSVPEPAYILTFVCLSAAYLTFGILGTAAQRSRVKPYPTWQKAVGTVLFALGTLLLLIVLIGLILTALH